MRKTSRGPAAPSLAVCQKGHVTETPLDEGCHFPTGEYQDEVFDTVEVGGQQVAVGARVYLGCGEPVIRAVEGAAPQAPPEAVPLEAGRTGNEPDYEGSDLEDAPAEEER